MKRIKVRVCRVTWPVEGGRTPLSYVIASTTLIKADVDAIYETEGATLEWFDSYIEVPE